MKYNIEAYEFKIDNAVLTIISVDYPIKPFLTISDSLGKRILTFEFCQQYLKNFTHLKSYKPVLSKFETVRKQYYDTATSEVTIASVADRLQKKLDNTDFAPLNANETYMHFAVDLENSWFNSEGRLELVEKVLLKPSEANHTEKSKFNEILNDTALPLKLEGYQVSGYSEKQRKICGEKYDGKLPISSTEYKTHQKYFNENTVKTFIEGNNISIGFCCATEEDKLSNRIAARIIEIETMPNPALINFKNVSGNSITRAYYKTTNKPLKEKVVLNNSTNSFRASDYLFTKTSLGNITWDDISNYVPFSRIHPNLIEFDVIEIAYNQEKFWAHRIVEPRSSANQPLYDIFRVTLDPNYDPIESRLLSKKDMLSPVEISGIKFKVENENIAQLLNKTVPRIFQAGRFPETVQTLAQLARIGTELGQIESNVFNVGQVAKNAAALTRFHPNGFKEILLQSQNRNGLLLEMIHEWTHATLPLGMPGTPVSQSYAREMRETLFSDYWDCKRNWTSLTPIQKRVAKWVFHCPQSYPLNERVAERFAFAIQSMTESAKATESVIPRFSRVVQAYVAEQSRLPVPIINTNAFSTTTTPTAKLPIKPGISTTSLVNSRGSMVSPRPIVEVQDPRAWNWRPAFSKGQQVRGFQRLNYPALGRVALKGLEPVLQVVLGFMDYQHYRENMPTSTDSDAVEYAVMHRIMGVVLDHVALTPEASFDPVLNEHCLDALRKIPVNTNTNLAQMMSNEGAQLALSIRDQAEAINKDVLGGRSSLLKMVADSIITDLEQSSDYAKRITTNPPKHPNPTAPWRVNEKDMQTYLKNLKEHHRRINDHNEQEHFNNLPGNASIPWEIWTKDSSFHHDLRDPVLFNTEIESNASFSFYPLSSFEFNQSGNRVSDAGFSSEIFTPEGLAWREQFNDCSFPQSCNHQSQIKLNIGNSQLTTEQKKEWMRSNARPYLPAQTGIHVSAPNELSFTHTIPTPPKDLSTPDINITISVDTNAISDYANRIFRGEEFTDSVEEAIYGTYYEWDIKFTGFKGTSGYVVVKNEGTGKTTKAYFTELKFSFSNKKFFNDNNKKISTAISDAISKRVNKDIAPILKNLFQDLHECYSSDGVNITKAYELVTDLSLYSDISEVASVIYDVNKDINRQSSLNKAVETANKCIQLGEFDKARTTLLSWCENKADLDNFIDECRVPFEINQALFGDSFGDSEELTNDALRPFSECLESLNNIEANTEKTQGMLEDAINKIHLTEENRVNNEIRKALFGDSFGDSEELTNSALRPFSECLESLNTIDANTEKTQGILDAKKAEIYHSLNDFQQAISFYASALAANPLDEKLALNYAKCCAENYQFDEACKILELFNNGVDSEGFKTIVDIREQQYQLQVQHLEVLFSHCFFSITQKFAVHFGSIGTQRAEQMLAGINQLFPSVLPLLAIRARSGWHSMSDEEKMAFKNQLRFAIKPWVEFNKNRMQATLNTFSLSLRVTNVLYANVLRHHLSDKSKLHTDMLIQRISLGLQSSMTIKNAYNFTMKKPGNCFSFMSNAPRSILSIYDHYHESKGNASENPYYSEAKKSVNLLGAGVGAMALLNPATSWLCIAASYVTIGVTLWEGMDQDGSLEEVYLGVLKNINFLRKKSLGIEINIMPINKAPHMYFFKYMGDYEPLHPWCHHGKIASRHEGWVVAYYDNDIKGEQDKYSLSLMKRYPNILNVILSNKKPSDITEQDKKQIKNLVTVHHQNQIREECLFKINKVITQDLRSLSSGCKNLGEPFQLREKDNQIIIDKHGDLIAAGSIIPPSSYVFYKTTNNDKSVVKELKHTLWVLQAEKALSQEDNMAYLSITEICNQENRFIFSYMDCGIELYLNFFFYRLKSLAKLGNANGFFEEIMKHTHYLSTKLKNEDYRKFISQLKENYKQSIHFFMQKIVAWFETENLDLKEKFKNIALKIYKVLWLKECDFNLSEDFNWFEAVEQENILSVPMQISLAEILMSSGKDEGLKIFQNISSEERNSEYWTSFARAYLRQDNIEKSLECISNISHIYDNLNALNILILILNKLIETRDLKKLHLFYFIQKHCVMALANHNDFNEMKGDYKNHINALKETYNSIECNLENIDSDFSQKIENGEIAQILSQVMSINTDSRTTSTSPRFSGKYSFFDASNNSQQSRQDGNNLSEKAGLGYSSD